MAKKAKKTTKKPTSKAVAKTAGKKKTAAAKNPVLSSAKSAKNKNSTIVRKSPTRTKSARPHAGTMNPYSSEPKPKAIQVLTKTYLTDEELEHFKLILLEKLHELTGDVDSIESEALRKNRAEATGDLSSMPIHMADIGSDTFEQDFTLGLMSSERKIVTEIIAALKRIKDGTYGICEGTGRPIPKLRLEANPWARYCIEYATRLEKGQLSRQEESRRWANQHKIRESESMDDTEPEEEEEEEYEEEEEEDENEFEPIETDPDLEDLYEIEEEGEKPEKEEPA